MEIVLVILAFILLLIGIIGAVIPMVPGPPLSFTGLLLIKFSGFGNLHPAVLWIFGIITLVVTVLDYLLPSFMAKKFGGSWAASLGSFLGLIAGLIYYPPFGMIIGSFIGAFVGELIYNRNKGADALKVAFGAFLAFLIGAGTKLVLSCLMLFVAIRVLF